MSEEQEGPTLDAGEVAEQIRAARGRFDDFRGRL
jgi:hypothetical protein